MDIEVYPMDIRTLQISNPRWVNSSRHIVPLQCIFDILSTDLEIATSDHRYLI